jgi:putative ABC transport system substrate-binding protein
VTGTTLASRGVAGKRLQLLKQVTPGMTRVGVMWVPSSVVSESQWRETIDAAESLGLEVLSLEVEQPADFPAALELAVQQRAEALFLPIHQVVMAQLGQIASFALAHQLPSMAFQREYVDQGGLLSYGASVPAMYHRAAYFVDRLLKGARVADLPVELPTTWDFIINSRTAQAMGLHVPDSVWSQATEIVS